MGPFACCPWAGLDALFCGLAVLYTLYFAKQELFHLSGGHLFKFRLIMDEDLSLTSRLSQELVDNNSRLGED